MKTLSPTAPKMNMWLVVGLYVVFVAVATLLTWPLLGQLPWALPGARVVSPWISIGVGLACAAWMVWITGRLILRYAWARDLAEGTHTLVYPLTVPRAIVLSVASGTGEEIFFRGALMPLIAALMGWILHVDPSSLGPMVIAWITSSAAFGAAHIGPDVRFRAWGWLAAAGGLVFGALTWLTGTVLAAIVCHMFLNLCNLRSTISR